MSNSGSIQSKVKCEYFHRESGLGITCEGLVEGAIIEQRFKRKEDKLIHLDSFCTDSKHCSYCEIYRAVQEANGE